MKALALVATVIGLVVLGVCCGGCAEFKSFARGYARARALEGRDDCPAPVTSVWTRNGVRFVGSRGQRVEAPIGCWTGDHTERKPITRWVLERDPILHRTLIVPAELLDR